MLKSLFTKNPFPPHTSTDENLIEWQMFRDKNDKGCQSQQPLQWSQTCRVVINHNGTAGSPCLDKGHAVGDRKTVF